MRIVLVRAACVALLISSVLAPSAVQARPKYVGAFKDQYKSLAATAEETKCNICHFGEKKSNRNDYGVEVGKALGAKNVMDVEEVKKALVKAEGGKSSVEGKTFGDLIKDGKLPGKNP